MPPTPQSNMERYLSIIAGHPTELPSQPASRVEYYLDEIVRNGDVNRLQPKPVTTLPTTGESKYLYLVPSQSGSGQNAHDEYIWVEESSKFELLGQAVIEVDPVDYATIQAMNTALAGKVDKVSGKGLSTNDYTTADKTKLAGIEDGANKTSMMVFKTGDGLNSGVDPINGGTPQKRLIINAEFSAQSGATITAIIYGQLYTSSFYYTNIPGTCKNIPMEVDCIVDLWWDGTNYSKGVYRAIFDSSPYTHFSYVKNINVTGGSGNHSLQLTMSATYGNIYSADITMILLGAEPATE